jgi:hypothetical protein
MQNQKSLENVSQVEDVRLVYALQGGRRGNACRGVYSSLDQLKWGVELWMKERPLELLSYLEFRLDYAPEPYGWDWCYIPVHSQVKTLAKGGGNVPLKSYWGRNLVNVAWMGIDEVRDYKSGDIVWYERPDGTKRVGQVQNHLVRCNQDAPKVRELWVKWRHGGGYLTLELLLKDMKRNNIQLHKM